MMIMRHFKLLPLILPVINTFPIVAVKSSTDRRFLTNCRNFEEDSFQQTSLALVSNARTTGFSQNSNCVLRNSQRRFPISNQLRRININAIPRSGGIGNNKSLSTEKNDVTFKVKKVGFVSLFIVLAALGVNYRDTIATFEFKNWLSAQLDTLSNLGTPGLIFYTFFFMLWEITVGITTPVETAAGMAFGLKKGIISNSVGKTSGAVCAFLLGRFVLKDYVTNKLEGNEYLDLVQYSIRKNPIRVALIWRFSFLPEFLKNFGLAILPVKTWQFVTAVLMHGFPFTMLWTFMGNEMGSVVRGTAKPSGILKVLISAVYVFGFFISPTLVALWVKSLRDEKKQRTLKHK